MPGVTTEVVDDDIARREAARAAGQPLPTFPAAYAVNAGYTMVATIRSEARLDRGPTEATLPAHGNGGLRPGVDLSDQA